MIAILITLLAIALVYVDTARVSAHLLQVAIALGLYP